jgi:hypothetical protein
MNKKPVMMRNAQRYIRPQPRPSVLVILVLIGLFLLSLSAFLIAISSKHESSDPRIIKRDGPRWMYEEDTEEMTLEECVEKCWVEYADWLKEQDDQFEKKRKKYKEQEIKRWGGREEAGFLYDE